MVYFGIFSILGAFGLLCVVCYNLGCCGLFVFALHRTLCLVFVLI